MDTFLIDRYAAYLAAGGRQSSTIKLRRSHLIAATRSIGSLETASSAQLEDYRANPGWKPTTRRSHRASIVQFYRWLLRSEHITINPAADLPPVIQPRAVPRPAHDAVIAAAIQAAPPRVQLMLELMAYAGLRRMEVARVHTKDVIVTDHASALRVTGKRGTHANCSDSRPPRRSNTKGARVAIPRRRFRPPISRLCGAPSVTITTAGGHWPHAAPPIRYRGIPPRTGYPRDTRATRTRQARYDDGLYPGG